VTIQVGIGVDLEEGFSPRATVVDEECVAGIPIKKVAHASEHADVAAVTGASGTEEAQIPAVRC
jgi:hypothetical protein